MNTQNTNNSISRFLSLVLMTIFVGILTTATFAQQRAVRDDFSGTGRSDFLLIEDVNGYLRFDILRNPVTSPANIRNVFWGLSSDRITFRDPEGDLKMNVGVWRPSDAANPNQAVYYIQPPNNPNPNAIIAVPWGLPTDITLSGDYDSDGKDDYTIARRDANKITYYSLLSGSNSFRATQWGLASDGILPNADFNGDGRDDLVIVRRDMNGNSTIFVGDASTGTPILTQPWGTANPVGSSGSALRVGNFIGDNRADIAIYYGACTGNPTCEIGGTVWIKETGSSNYTVTKFGIPFDFSTGAGDIPDNADFDGDGKEQITVYRRENNTFYWINSSNGQVRGQYFNGISATPPGANANLFENTFEPRRNLIPAGAFNSEVIIRQPDGTYKTELMSDILLKNQ